jgi:hypothetical protein
VKSASAKSGFAVEVESRAVTGAPLRHKSVFKDKAMAAKWKAIASTMFKATRSSPDHGSV